jgi:hypothetical protein
MERRIGRARMAESLTRFIRERSGKRADWADLADAFGGDDAKWLREWLTIPGAPRFIVADLAVKDGFVEGELRVDPSRFDGVLQLGVVTNRDVATMRMDEAPPLVHDIAFEGYSTRFRLPLPEGATGLLIDPNHHLPRRWDDFAGGLYVPLPK